MTRHLDTDANVVLQLSTATVGDFPPPTLSPLFVYHVLGAYSFPEHLVVELMQVPS